ncbi:MAG: potassium transporter Kef [Polyangiaceae bacterium]|nr:potassium transporter Kef [Polyangiaceae bacterium]
MSPIVVLTGLLALAYLGSMLVGGRTIRGFGLPSGTEFLVLGVFLGPRFMGVFTRQGLAGYSIITIVALAWLSFVMGSDYGYAAGRKLPAKRMFFGLALALLAGLFTALPAVALAFFLTDLSLRELLILGLGVGAVSAETTPYAIRFVVQRYSADGPLTRLLADVCEADDALPIVLLAVLATIVPGQTTIPLPGMPWTGLASTLAIGATLGATCAALFDIEPRSSQRWGILLGTGLLCVGVCLRLGLSAVSAMFVMGMLATGLAKERRALQELLATTERAVMLPALVLAGAHIVFPDAMPFVPIAIVVVVMRVVAKGFSGRILGRTLEAKHGPQSLGLGLLPAGILSIAIGLAFAMRYPGVVSEWVLALAALNALIGEVVGTAFLRRALRNAGEISEASAGATPLPVRKLSPAEMRAAARLLRTSTRPPARSSSATRQLEGRARRRSSQSGAGT